VALYEALNVVTVPLALNSGLFWPRRSTWRYPGTIVDEFLPPLPTGLPRAEFRRRVEGAIETASRQLIDEAARAPSPPPLARAQSSAD
jgi:1-acyl-sn-glycerol-3-phosphate acyltransferase